MDEVEALFAPGEISRLVGKLVDAVRARWGRILGLGLVLAAVAFAWTRVCPRVYTSRASVFAIPAAGSAGGQRGAAGEVVGLSEGAARVVLSEGALEALSHSLKLERSWPEPRGELAQKLHELGQSLGLSSPEGNPHQALLAALRKAISVKVDDSTVEISVQWPDPEQAQAIAQASVDRLFAARHQIELAPLETKVAALDARLAGDDSQVKSHQQRVAALLAAKRRGVKASTVHGLQSRGKFRDLPDPELSRLRQKILTERKAIADLEDVWQKRTAELQAKLAEQSATLGPKNPLVLDTQDKLEALRAQGTELDARKASEQKLLAQFVRAGGNERELEPGAVPLFAPELESEDPDLGFEKVSLSNALVELQGVRSDLLSAKLALESAAATFEARYVEMVKPEAPTHPSSPRTALTCLAALLVGLLSGLLWSLAKGPVQASAPRPLGASEPVRS